MADRIPSPTHRQGLYVHIPFCHSKCPYCDFYSVASTAFLNDYIEALMWEMTLRQEEFQPDSVSLYFGGGTPSTLPLHAVEKVMKTARVLYGLRTEAEVTFELNPGDVTSDYLRGLQAIGVNRLSIGIQSADDGVLQFLGRRHSAYDSQRVLEEARVAGFSNLSGDMIYGVPQQSEASVYQTCEKMVEWGCSHVSAYHLTIEPATIFGLKYRQGRLHEVDEEVSVRHYEIVGETLVRLGLMQYEVSSYSREGFQSNHNQLYWQGFPCAGFGPGAHSYDGVNTRSWNPAGLKEYIGALSKGELPIKREVLSPEELFEEWLLTRLRTVNGIDVLEGATRFGGERIQRMCKAAKPWVEKGVLLSDNERFYLKGDGFLLMDRVILDLAM